MLALSKANLGKASFPNLILELECGRLTLNVIAVTPKTFGSVIFPKLAFVNKIQNHSFPSLLPSLLSASRELKEMEGPDIFTKMKPGPKDHFPREAGPTPFASNKTDEGATPGEGAWLKTCTPSYCT